MKQSTTHRTRTKGFTDQFRSLTSVLDRRKLAVPVALAAIASPAAGDLTFVQTFDGWWSNTYTWAAQVETVVCLRNFDPIGTVKPVWARVVQKNGSGVGTAVFCTTMTKTAAGITDRWDVNVPAGMISDKDFWDASIICVELVNCARGQRIGYNSIPTPYGSLAALDYPPDDLDPEPTTRYVSLDPTNWDDQAVRDDGFDFAVYAYMTDFGEPIILNHVDELGLSTFNYDHVNAFGTGQPYDPNQLQILGVNLDPSWDQIAQKSDGLNFFQWKVFPGGGLLFTDQGVFQILQIEPIIPGWLFICPADINEDGDVNFFDISAFVNLLLNNDPAADFNGDGDVNFFDISAFISAFSKGCQ